MGELVAGVDSSTQSTKVVVIDVDTGETVATGRADHDVTGTGGARETDPEQWWSALSTALAETGRAGDVRALSVAGQQHGLVVTDAAGEYVRPAVLWNDIRSAEDAEALIDDLGGAGAWADQIGLVPVASFTVTTWAWLRRTEPDTADRVHAIRLPHDELTFRLTGRSVTDRGDASGTGWWSTASQRYDRAVLDLERVALDPDMLPTVLGPGEAAGTVDAAVARDLGLTDDVLVGPGTGDNMAAALGMGLHSQQAAMSLGTSGTVYARSDRRPADPEGVVAGFADATGRYLPLAATLNATLAVDRMAEWLQIDREAVEPSNGVVVMPFLDGERTPDLPHAAGTVTGLRHDTTPGQILQATYEGVVVSLLDALDRVLDQAGAGSGDTADAPLLLTGGGARGTVWRDTVRRLSGRALRIPAVDEAVAVGAAVQAAAVLTGTAPEEVAVDWGCAAGEELEAMAADRATSERHADVRRRTEALNRDRATDS